MVRTSGTTGEHSCRMLKKARILTRPTPAAISPARPESAKTASSPWDAHNPERGPSNSLHLPLGEWPRLRSTARIERGHSNSLTSPEGVGRLFFTARIERPPFYRGGSASKKNGLPAPSHHSEAARCASTEDHQAPSPPLFCEQEGHLAAPSPRLLAVLSPNPYTDIVAIQPGLNSPARSSIS